MKISVISGSPKGEQSVTLQYINYIIKKHPEHEFNIHYIGNRIKRIEREEELINSIMDNIKNSNIVIWATPVYYLTVPSQLMRFIELIWERNMEGIFKDKYAASITTSIHFHDHSAHNYLHAVCDSLDMHYIDFYSPYMSDLLEEEGRKRLLLFAENIFETAKSGAPSPKHYLSPEPMTFQYSPGIPDNTFDQGDKKIIIIAGALEPGSNLEKMTAYFRNCYSGPVELIDLREIDIKNGCTGCIQCSFDNQCAYIDKDGFTDFYENTVKKADAIIFAGTIKNHFLSSRLKMYLDRTFYNNHVPSIQNKQVGFLISGRLRQDENIREVFKSYVEIQKANLVDFVTDEYGDSRLIDNMIKGLAERITRLCDKNYSIHKTFLAVGGWKIFRDEIWGKLRFVFQADHKYYMENGIYDFPQDDEKSLEFSRQMIELLNDIKIRNDFKKNMRIMMLEQYKQIVDSA